MQQTANDAREMERLATEPASSSCELLELLGGAESRTVHAVKSDQVGPIRKLLCSTGTEAEGNRRLEVLC